MLKWKKVRDGTYTNGKFEVAYNATFESWGLRYPGAKFHLEWGPTPEAVIRAIPEVVAALARMAEPGYEDTWTVDGSILRSADGRFQIHSERGLFYPTDATGPDYPRWGSLRPVQLYVERLRFALHRPDAKPCLTRHPEDAR